MGKNKYYCKIDGKVYNLKKIQDIIDENPEHPDIARIYVTAVEEYHLPSNTMIDSVITFNNNEIPADYNEALRKMQEHNKAKLKKLPPKSRCPRCGSTDIKYCQGLVNSEIGLYEQYYICNNCFNTFDSPR